MQIATSENEKLKRDGGKNPIEEMIVSVRVPIFVRESSLTRLLSRNFRKIRMTNTFPIINCENKMSDNETSSTKSKQKM